MKIAIVAGPFLKVPPDRYGGVEQVIFYLIKGLVEAGHQPILLGVAGSQAGCPLIPICPKPIYFPTSPQDRQRHQKLSDKIAKTTAIQLKKLLPDVDLVHFHNFLLNVPFKIPKLITLHNPTTILDLPNLMNHKSLAYVSVSKNQQAACPDLNYVSTIHNAEDPADFPIITEPDDYVCFLGRMDRGKNPHLAIQLALYLGLRIKLAGKIDHDGAAYFKQEIEPYLDNPLVEWLGELDKPGKTELLSKALCNLHPTNFREPFGLTVIEAAYCGTPTLAVSRGALPEIIEQGKTGMLVEDFTEGYFQLQKCLELDRRYIAASARSRFNYQKMASQYLDAYKKVIRSYNKANG